MNTLNIITAMPKFVTSSASLHPRKEKSLIEPEWEARVQHTADVLALIPILNIPASFVSGLISLRRRDYVGVALSVVGMIPIEGECAVAFKMARHACELHNVTKTGMKVARLLRDQEISQTHSTASAKGIKASLASDTQTHTVTSITTPVRLAA